MINVSEKKEYAGLGFYTLSGLCTGLIVEVKRGYWVVEILNEIHCEGTESQCLTFIQEQNEALAA
jgi:hypothetical protein